jgi:hypothetical protein
VGQPPTSLCCFAGQHIDKGTALILPRYQAKSTTSIPAATSALIPEQSRSRAKCYFMYRSWLVAVDVRILCIRSSAIEPINKIPVNSAKLPQNVNP